MSGIFYGGIHPAGFKTLTSDRPIKRTFIPKRVVLPLSQHTGSPAEAMVKAGDMVKVGQQVARATGFVSSPIHASISGKVTRIAHSPTPTQARSLSIVIESDGSEDQQFSPVHRDVEALSKEELLGIIRDAGIVGMGGAAFPTYVKLSPPKNKPINTVILNGAECEPYLTCDHRLMIEKSQEILKGLDIIVKILGAKEAYIAIEDNKLSAIYAMEKAVAGKSNIGPRIVSRRPDGGVRARVVVMRAKYPQGAEKQVIKSVLNKTVPAGGLPMDVGCVVQNVGTVFAIYEAVYKGKPLIERAMTITGPCVKEPMNAWVRLGTTLRDLAGLFGGFVKEPAKVVIGGPMMGIAQYTLDVPIVKGTSGVVFIPKDEAGSPEEGVCIRCGKCVEVCPMGLMPTALMYRVKNEIYSEAKDMGVTNCFECGACAYACPAKIPLLDYMKFGKAKVIAV